MLTTEDLQILGVEASHNGIMAIDCSGTIIIYNKAAKNIFNFDDIELVGEKLSKFRPDAWKDMQVIIKTGVPQIGKKIVLPEATIIANRTPIYDSNEIVGVVSVFQDVSEHEKIVSQMQNYKKLHKELEVIFESSYDGFYLTDGDANTVRVNKSYERITGLSRNDLLGKNMKSLVEDHIFDHSVTLEVLQKKEPVTLMQQVAGEKQVIVTGTPVFSDNGEISVVVTNVRDISELNELRAQLNEYRKRNSFFYNYLKEHQEVNQALKDLVIKSQAMIRVIQKAVKVSKVEASVLLNGESGVGKSMLAKLIHTMGPRKEGPFVKINCGAIPTNLMESELFGYEKGAFTGASSEGKIGLVEAASGGTLFFDEIAELKPDMQVNLLEVIEEKGFKRVGSTKTTSVDVHIIAATNQNLEEQIQKGLFREDLFYRLNVVPITIPPLRRRREDIPALVDSILEKFNRLKELNKSIDPTVIEILRQYDYPGNVRELINIIERMIVLSDGDILVPEDLPTEMRAQDDFCAEIFSESFPLKDALQDYESKLIRQALDKKRSITKAAKLLKIHPTTLWRKMSKYNLNSYQGPS